MTLVLTFASFIPTRSLRYLSWVCPRRQAVKKRVDNSLVHSSLLLKQEEKLDLNSKGLWPTPLAPAGDCCHCCCLKEHTEPQTYSASLKV